MTPERNESDNEGDKEEIKHIPIPLTEKYVNDLFEISLETHYSVSFLIHMAVEELVINYKEHKQNGEDFTKWMQRN